MNRSAERIARAGESAIRAVHRLARTESQEAAREQRRVNKRKILLGCALIEMMKKDTTLSARVESFMKGYLQRRGDINAFDLDEPINYFEQARRAPQASGVQLPQSGGDHVHGSSPRTAGSRSSEPDGSSASGRVALKAPPQGAAGGSDSHA